MTEDQVEELMKAFAQADKVSHYMYVTLIESETFVVFRKQFNYIRIVTINEILIITLLQIYNAYKYPYFENGDGILTVEEYKTAFHEHGVFVGGKNQ